MTEPRDWDRELANIDKVIARQGPAAPAASAPSSAPAPAAPGGAVPVRTASRGAGALASLATWVRVLLGLGLALGITQWPYPSACGLNLAVYLTAVVVIVLAGGWSALSSWRRQMGLAHLLSLLVLLWGLVLAAREILPRVGYAAQSRAWSCGAPAAAP